MFEAYPDIGAARVAEVDMITGIVDRLRRDEMLPAVVMVLAANGFQAAGIVETGHGKFIEMHGDAVELGNYPARVFILYKVVGQSQHGAVEGEVGAEGSVLADGIHVTGNPVIALLGASREAGRYQRKRNKDVAESAGKHRRLFDQTLICAKSLHKSEIFLWHFDPDAQMRFRELLQNPVNLYFQNNFCQL